RRDAGLDHGLLVLGVVVLGVLGDVPELARLLDALGNLAALRGLQIRELHFEPLESFWGEDDVLGHTRLVISGCRQKTPLRSGESDGRGWQEAGQYSARAWALRRRRRRDADATARRARRRRIPWPEGRSGAPWRRRGGRGTTGRTSAGSAPRARAP